MVAFVACTSRQCHFRIARVCSLVYRHRTCMVPSIQQLYTLIIENHGVKSKDNNKIKINLSEDV